jgi:hypothetical protein
VPGKIADILRRLELGLLEHPSGIFRPSERGLRLGAVVGLAIMKQRGHQDLMLG